MDLFSDRKYWVDTKNDINRLYERFGPNFCLCPFLGAFYQTFDISSSKDQIPANTLRPCSLTDFTRPTYTIQDRSIINTLNSDHWREVRRSFTEGRYWEIPDCKICQDTERIGGSPARKGANLHYLHHCTSDVIQEVERVIANDYRVDRILSLDFFPSNYCNFACVMCAGGASSTRMSWEIKIHKQPQKIVLNEVDDDFFEILQHVEVINFTGGETVMQQQVHDMIDYLIQEGMAPKITIFLLTNASTYPENLIDKFRQFRRVVYMCSIDGVGPVIEYQRRGAIWPEVEQNALRLIHHEFISTVVNVVITAINLLDLHQLVSWFVANKVKGISLSQVFRVEHIGIAAAPPAIRDHALSRLSALRTSFVLDTEHDAKGRELCDQISAMINNIPYDPRYLNQFQEYITQEDQASDKKFLDVMPEWRPYFDTSV